MKTKTRQALLIAAVSLGSLTSALAAGLDTAKIDALTGLKGKLNEKESVYKVTFPRADIPVTVDGWRMPPFMGLGTWASFVRGSGRRR